MISIREFVRRVQTAHPWVSRADALDMGAFFASIPFTAAALRMEEPLIAEDGAEHCLSLLHDDTPPAYITGRREFFGHEFAVTPDVLIPRHETEILVEQAVAAAKPGARVLDICTGSGCILASILAAVPDSTGVGVDISPAVLTVAEKNLVIAGAESRARLVQADALAELPLNETFDIITMNPPYVTEAEYAEGEPSLFHEPKLALVGEDEGLVFYKKVLCYVHKFCKTGGLVFWEIGARQGGAAAELAAQAGYQPEVIADYAGHARIIRFSVHS